MSALTNRPPLSVASLRPARPQRMRPAIVIVGLRYGRTVLQGLMNRNGGGAFDVAGVCDLDGLLAEEVSACFGLRRFRCLEEIIETPSVDCVGLFTGPTRRAGFLDELIAGGKAVLTTKPFETDVDATAAVLARARQAGLSVHCNSPSPAPVAELRHMQDLMASGIWGRAVQARASIWASYRETADGSWYDRCEECPAAPILRLGIYTLNDLCDLFGECQSLDILSSRIRTGRPTADNAVAQMGFPSGVLASVQSSFCMDGYMAYQNEIEILCEGGVIRRQREASEPGEERTSVAVYAAQGGMLREVDRQSFSQPSGTYPLEHFANAVVRNQSNSAEYDARLLRSVALIDRLRHAETRIATS